MAADGTVADSTTHHLGVVLIALKGLTQHIQARAGDFATVEAYLNVFPDTHEQFNAIYDACDEAGIDVACEVRNGMVCLTCGTTPAPPVVVWHPEPSPS